MQPSTQTEAVVRVSLLVMDTLRVANTGRCLVEAAKTTQVRLGQDAEVAVLCGSDFDTVTGC